MSRTARPSFEELFGRRPQVVAQAPGRVNVIGDHTDYNGGWVLPMPLPHCTQVELGWRGDETVRVFSADVSGHGELQEYQLGAEAHGRGWLDYVQAVTWVLGGERVALPGVDLRISSSVPIGSGLSSSAALLVAVLRAIREAVSLPMNDLQLALLAHRAEYNFVGAPVGVMDQMASSLGRPGTALLIDTRALTFAHVDIPPEIELVVIHSGIAHDHAAGDYRVRRSECEQACALLGITQLRDLAEADGDRVAALPDPLSRRVRHVINENARVLRVVEVFRSGDLPALKPLLDQSHESLRSDYQVSIPEVDLLVELALQDPDALGARLTGGGFGGSVLIAARAGAGADVAQRVARDYAARTGRQARIILPELPSPSRTPSEMASI